jgi:hypothetical protein
MIFTADGKMTRQPRGKSGKRSSGTWKLDTSGFCTSWKGAGTNCYTVVRAAKTSGRFKKALLLLQCGQSNLQNRSIGGLDSDISFFAIVLNTQQGLTNSGILL